MWGPLSNRFLRVGTRPGSRRQSTPWEGDRQIWKAGRCRPGRGDARPTAVVAPAGVTRWVPDNTPSTSANARLRPAAARSLYLADILVL